MREDLIRAKRLRKKWTMLTAYDAPTAEILERAGVDWILVGDSLGMVVLGYPTTTQVSMDEMIHHAKAVRRGAQNSYIIGDMPLSGVRGGPAQSFRSAKRFMDEAGCDAVKIEWSPTASRIIQKLVRHKIPVMGHIGLTPQTVDPKRGFHVQGKKAGEAVRIAQTAAWLQAHGAFSVILECVPASVAQAITQWLRIPTIGIGSGAGCDGQVLVFHDLVGIFTKFEPRFVKRYARLSPLMKKAVRRYIEEVRRGKFPAKRHSFGMKKEEWKKFQTLMRAKCPLKH